MHSYEIFSIVGFRLLLSIQLIYSVTGQGYQGGDVPQCLGARGPNLEKKSRGADIKIDDPIKSQYHMLWITASGRGHLLNNGKYFRLYKLISGDAHMSLHRIHITGVVQNTLNLNIADWRQVSVYRSLSIGSKSQPGIGYFKMIVQWNGNVIEFWVVGRYNRL